MYRVYSNHPSAGRSHPEHRRRGHGVYGRDENAGGEGADDLVQARLWGGFEPHVRLRLEGDLGPGGRLILVLSLGCESGRGDVRGLGLGLGWRGHVVGVGVAGGVAGEDDEVGWSASPLSRGNHHR